MHNLSHGEELDDLVDGYRRFRAGAHARQSALYRDLSERGQTPRVMVISCCDSRVDPSAIFDAGPGELFVLRNVANLVPPYEPLGEYHGTSAAIEFAVTELEVRTILVLGHAQCGGIRAFLEGLHETAAARSFIAKWISLLRPAAAGLLHEDGWRDPARRQRMLERAAIAQSLENLATFPFVRERVEGGFLELLGGYFSIATGELLLRDAASGSFVAAAEESA